MQRNATDDIAPWVQITGAIGPINVDAFHRLVREPVFASQPICSICAIVVDAQWPLKEGAKFEDHTCVGCGRFAPTTEAGNWSWK